MKGVVTCNCVVCHRDNNINSDDTSIYDAVVRENWVCLICWKKVKKIRIVLKCEKCGREFATKVLAENKDKYVHGWKCPLCVSNALPQPKVSQLKKCDELSCDGCMSEKGVCNHPELQCSLSKTWANFGNGSLTTIKQKECSILSIHRIDKERDDIHCFGYTVLYREKCSLSPANYAIVRQRMGSKKHFTTNVIVYKYNAHKHQFEVVYDKNFERGTDWVVPTRDFLLTNK